MNFEAFGQVAGSSGSSASPYMYAGDWGYRNDGDAGLMHVGARYYDAQVGRFITRDTVLSEHPYLYCEHEPVGAVDAAGAGPKPVDGLGQVVTVAASRRLRAVRLPHRSLGSYRRAPASGSSVAPCRNRSMPRAASRPSVMAQTMSDCPRRMSPAAKTPRTLVM